LVVNNIGEPLQADGDVLGQTTTLQCRPAPVGNKKHGVVPAPRNLLEQAAFPHSPPPVETRQRTFPQAKEAPEALPFIDSVKKIHEQYYALQVLFIADRIHSCIGHVCHVPNQSVRRIGDILIVELLEAFSEVLTAIGRGWSSGFHRQGRLGTSRRRVCW
jgi:hypothetical protein